MSPKDRPSGAKPDAPGEFGLGWFTARAIPPRDHDGSVARRVRTTTHVDSQERSNESPNLVLEAANALFSSLDDAEIRRKFAALAVARFADSCLITLNDADGRETVVAVEHYDPRQTRKVKAHKALLTALVKTLPLQTLEREGPIVFEGAAAAWIGARSAIMVPLATTSGECYGRVILCTGESRPAFGASDLEIARMLATCAAVAIANAHTIAEARRTSQRLRLLEKVSEKLFDSLDVTKTFTALAGTIASEMADLVLIVRLADGDSLQTIAAAHRDPAKQAAIEGLNGVRIFQPKTERATVRALRQRKALVREGIDPLDIAASARPYLSTAMPALEPQSSITVPIHSRGKTHGAIIAFTTRSARTYREDDAPIFLEIGRRASIAVENADVFERERHVVETLQDSLLPPSLPVIPGLRFDAVYLANCYDAQVGGDWYDAFQLDDGSIVVSSGDVGGRGPHAAVIMGKIRHLLAIAPLYERDPARILDTIESVLARRYPDAIATAFLGIINPDRTQIRYANAGHPYPLLRRSNDMVELRADGLPLGLRGMSDQTASSELSLTDAKMLIFYTDGLIESTHDVLEGRERLGRLVMTDALLHSHNAARFIKEACLPRPTEDDVAILTIAFDASLRWAFDAENAGAAHDARGAFAAHLRKHSNDHHLIAGAELVFGELVSNVARHAPGPIDIDLDWTGEFPVLHVIDRGPAFDVSTHLPDDILSESGRGLFIIRQFSRRCAVERIEGYGNHVMAELPIRRK